MMQTIEEKLLYLSREGRRPPPVYHTPTAPLRALVHINIGKQGVASTLKALPFSRVSEYS